MLRIYPASWLQDWKLGHDYRRVSTHRQTQLNSTHHVQFSIFYQIRRQLPWDSCEFNTHRRRQCDASALCIGLKSLSNKIRWTSENFRINYAITPQCPNIFELLKFPWSYFLLSLFNYRTPSHPFMVYILSMHMNDMQPMIVCFVGANVTLVLTERQWCRDSDILYTVSRKVGPKLSNLG